LIGYRQIIFKVLFVALPWLAMEEIIKWFRSNLLEFLFLDGEISLKDKIRKRLAQEVIRERDNFKMVLVRSMEENEQIIGNKSIGEWLKDYRLFLIDNKKDRRLAQAEYLLRKVDILGSDGKEIVIKLLNFYDFLHLSSYTIEGNEDPQLIKDDDGYYGLYNGKIFKINFGDGKQDNDNADAGFAERKSTKEGVKVNQDNTQKIVLDLKDKLRQELDNFLSSQMVSEITKVKGGFGGVDVKTLRNSFYQAVNVGKAEEAVAALLLIAESGGLREAFAGDERFIKFWGDYLAKNMSAGTGEFAKDPANPKDLARFLQYILESRLKMKGDETAMVGVLISNSARVAGDLNYKTLAYGDMESGEFRWNV